MLWQLVVLLSLHVFAISAQRIALRATGDADRTVRQASGAALEDYAQQAAALALARYGPPIPARHRQRRQSMQDITLGNALRDTVYYAPLRIGTPHVELNLIMDTGSSDMWTVGPGCRAGCPAAATIYDIGASSTAQASDTPFAIRYGAGSASGVLVRDVVTLGNWTLQQTFAQCDNVSKVLRDGLDVSGIMGLAYRSLATSQVEPLWQTLADSHLADPLFSFALNRAADGETSEEVQDGGLATFGSIDHALHSGAIDYLPLLSSSFWMVSLQGVEVDGQPAALQPGARAAIDTATTLIGGPPAALAAVFAGVPGAELATGLSYNGYWTAPCSRLAATNISIVLQGVAYPLDPRDVNLGTLSNRSMCLTSFFEIASNSDTAPQWVLGATFLKNVYAVFRAGPNAAVGFAARSDGTTALVPSSSRAISPVAPISTANAAIAVISPKVTTSAATSTLPSVVLLSSTVLASWLWQCLPSHVVL